MAKGRRRAMVRQAVARSIRIVAGSLGPTVADEEELEPIDVVFDAFAVISKAGIGWDMVYVDVRPVQAVHTLPDAQHIPLAELRAREAEVPRDVTVVVVGETEAEGVQGALVLRAAGHDDAWGLGGGLAAWKREGGELEPL